MGNDGGSIPDRRDLVRTKAKAEQADKNNQTIARWFFCALSKLPLQEPVVSCALGKLYNKDSVLEYLLDKSIYGDGETICGHVRSLKDVKTLKLTRNPATEVTSSEHQAKFACPLTLKEMNGGQPFVYIWTCGCVFSQSGLRSVRTTTTTPPPTDDAKHPQSKDLCPQCSTPFLPSMDIITLNPSEEEEEKMRASMELRRAAAQSANTKSKKRKAAVGASDIPSSEQPKKKKVAAPVTNHATATSKSVAQALALEEKLRKSTMSDAVKSLYAPKDAPVKETFMTRTFTRYA